MDAMQIAIPVVGIAAAAVLTFYAVSFAEVREKSFKDLDDSDDGEGELLKGLSSRERRARRKADKQDRRN